MGAGSLTKGGDRVNVTKAPLGDETAISELCLKINLS